MTGGGGLDSGRPRRRTMRHEPAAGPAPGGSPASSTTPPRRTTRRASPSSAPIADTLVALLDPRRASGCSTSAAGAGRSCCPRPPRSARRAARPGSTCRRAWSRLPPRARAPLGLPHDRGRRRGRAGARPARGLVRPHRLVAGALLPAGPGRGAGGLAPAARPGRAARGDHLRPAGRGLEGPSTRCSPRTCRRRCWTRAVPGGSGPFASDAGVERLLGDAGFEQVRTVTHDLDVRFADADQWHAFSWSTGQRAVWERIRAGRARPRCAGGRGRCLSRPAPRAAVRACASRSATPWGCRRRRRLGRP